MSDPRLTLPNLITFGRILVTPLVAWFVLSPGTAMRLAAFVLFLAAALSDIWDGYLARKHGWVTDMGKLLDPLADKLLLAVTMIHIYFISHRPGEENAVPLWGPLPLWVLLVILGREFFITLFRSYASRRGVVIAAGKSGKHKALVQNLFVGGLLLWYPLLQWAQGAGVTGTGAWGAWALIHRAWIGVTLALALVLTIYSMLDYLWRYRSLAGFRS
ncbi:MAG TPA: CDP-diacylglycerol--glycerol-3-phosphate 3-phosphatidyltransferase [Longimicrobiales bacterium]|nr:CDP-diacylglycerol--glycerol-3-phosphate 3-phosphatidyltransferase [Longimicrobiales bacterium]